MNARTIEGAADRGIAGTVCPELIGAFSLGVPDGVDEVADAALLARSKANVAFLAKAMADS
jgi:hypothetical protein